MVAGGKISYRTFNELKWNLRAVNLSVFPTVGLSGLVAPGTKHSPNSWAHFWLLHKLFQRLGKILGLVGAGLAGILGILGMGANAAEAQD